MYVCIYTFKKYNGLNDPDLRGVSPQFVHGGRPTLRLDQSSTPAKYSLEMPCVAAIDEGKRPWLTRP